MSVRRYCGRNIVLGAVGLESRPDSNIARACLLVTFFALALGLSGCTTRLDVKSVDGDFGGLGEAIARTAAKGGVLRVVTVHGVGNPGWNYSKGLTRGLADRLDLLEDPNATEVFRIDRDGCVPFAARDDADGRLGTLRIVRFHGLLDPERRVEIYEVDWSPATRVPRLAYLEDDNVEDSARPRAYLNRAIKKDLINERLSDTILYAGRYHEVMQRPLLLSLDRLFVDENADTDELAFVTESLGSAITLDALASATAGKQRGTLPELSRAVARPREVVIFMLANPIPLLRLARFNPDDDEAGPNPFPPVWSATVVAISDPNDLLSYPIYPRMEAELAQQGGLAARFVNVTVSIAKSAVFGLMANPLEAHSGHTGDPFVLNLLSWGYPSLEVPAAAK